MDNVTCVHTQLRYRKEGCLPISISFMTGRSDHRCEIFHLPDIRYYQCVLYEIVWQDYPLAHFKFFSRFPFPCYCFTEQLREWMTTWWRPLHHKSCYGMGASNVYAPAFQLLRTIWLTDNPICVYILMKVAFFRFMAWTAIKLLVNLLEQFWWVRCGATRPSGLNAVVKCLKGSPPAAAPYSIH